MPELRAPWKRYLLFKGEASPDGGGLDFYGTFDTLEEAERRLFRDPPYADGMWAHVLDCEKWGIGQKWETFYDTDREEPCRDWRRVSEDT